jgi:hypothetical protein
MSLGERLINTAGRRGNEMITFLKSAQLVTAFAVVALFWLIYPGIMVILASGVGLIYVAASIGAILENRLAIWTAFVFSAIAAIFSAFSVHQFLRNGFDFLAGTFDQTDVFYLPPYLFLAISIGATLVVIAHLTSWRWMVPGQPKETI